MRTSPYRSHPKEIRVMASRNYTVTTKTGTVGLDVSVSDRGDGRSFLLLHGGAGPQSVLAFADLLAAEGDARVLVPTHPGFSGTPRPESLHTVRDLAAVYVALLDELDLRDVSVIGNSIGGWIAAEMALPGRPFPGPARHRSPPAAREPPAAARRDPRVYRVAGRRRAGLTHPITIPARLAGPS
jgi:hypothetical protein